MKNSTTKSPTHLQVNSPQQPRIVLLLDLDCFYAQCETVRLNLPQTLPLCLLQWNSALAVNYPARDFGIKRGDGFEDIQKKGKGQVIALHLPVLPIQYDTSNDVDEHTSIMEDKGPKTIEELYNQQFQLSPQQQKETFEKEKNIMRKPEEGKASLDRYRLASSRIFTIILECLTDLCGSKNFILEKASIDELFVDVSDYCYSNKNICSSTKEVTTIVHPTHQSSFSAVSTTEAGDDEDIDKDEIALWKGCEVAQLIRKAVFDKLGFTLSAGVSINKLMAKLGAGYGKPNGQAVIFPDSIAKVMEETKIRKVRNLGGKLGKSVQAILPPNSEKVSSISQNLSLPQLTQHLKSHETALFVFNISRGICNEPVKATHRVLNKSITSFKSFPKVNNLHDLKPYVKLLAKDLIRRVAFDCKWNERWPKSCSIQYTYVNTNIHKKNGKSKSVRDHRHNNELCTKSIRVAFLNRDTYKGEKNNFEQLFLDKVFSTIESKLNHCFPMCRIGLSAIDFETQCVTKGIDSFFRVKESQMKKQKRVKFEQKLDSKQNECSTVLKISEEIQQNGEEKIEKKLNQIESTPTLVKNVASISESSEQNICKSSREQLDHENFSKIVAPSSLPLDTRLPSLSRPGEETHTKQIDKDMIYAQKLQASFDRESEVLAAVEKNGLQSRGRKRESSMKKRKQHAGINNYFTKQTKKLDSFFRKKT